jgi:hypothetical protein
MSATKKKEDRPLDPLQEKPIAHMYGLVEDPLRPGNFFAIHGTKVFCEEIEHLEPSDRSSYPLAQMNRLIAAMMDRHRKREWSK